jgi:hypothetical protein
MTSGCSQANGFTLDRHNISKEKRFYIAPHVIAYESDEICGQRGDGGRVSQSQLVLRFWCED